ncbi:MAG: DegT/DnrJ/EryC1/StrS family aminotransferase [Pseudomonadota bacterium]
MHSVIWYALNSCPVATNDGDLAAELRLTRNFGFADIDRVDALGTNAKMSEAHAAIGLANLNIIEATIDASR